MDVPTTVEFGGFLVLVVGAKVDEDTHASEEEDVGDGCGGEVEDPKSS